MLFTKRFTIHLGLLAILVMVVACVPKGAQRSEYGDDSGVTTSGGSGGQGSVPTTSGSLGGGDDEDNSPPLVEIRNLVEPHIVDDQTYSTGTGVPGAGTYVRKLTLPKNYSGLLYIGGINVNSLSSRLVKVRFNFGVNRDPITVQATVAKAPGITPSTNIDVLVLDLRSRPFKDVRLLYDLYDYNDYSGGMDPVESNRDQNLYCRGLRLEDDATFDGQGACDGLDATNAPNSEKCLYTYAKIIDKGLVKKDGTTYTPTYPTLPQTDASGTGYYKDAVTNLVNRCLPDQASGAYKLSEANAPTGLLATTFTAFGNIQTVTATGYSQQFLYDGAFAPVNESNWFLADRAIFGSKGLFNMPYPGSVNLDYGYNSLMFPREAKMDLNASVAHLSSATGFASKGVTSLAAAGRTDWMYGCNARVQSVNGYGEHVGSCNVTAKIELIARDDNDVEYVITETNDVVLQLVRSSQITEQNGEVLYDNFKTCQNSSQCGSAECCFSGRCWSRTLVSQCVEESSGTGNLGVGSQCSTDFDCSSMCCNRSTGLCAIHNNLLNPPTLCQKPYGDFCLAREWCQKSVVTSCYIVKTGTTPLGAVTCAKRCYSTLDFGSCKNSICVPPDQPQDFEFDPNAAGACDSAIEPPNF